MVEALVYSTRIHNHSFTRQPSTEETMNHITINVAGDFIATQPTSAGGELGPLLFSAQLSQIAEPVSRFIKILSDGSELPADSTRTDHVVVQDAATGLTWLVESIGKSADEGMSQQDCVKACAKLDTLGFKDWRLPTRSELIGLIDDTRIEPAIDTSIFPHVKPRLHWTSTAYEGNPSASAWFVLFYVGYVYGSHRDYDGFALAVRRSGQ